MEQLCEGKNEKGDPALCQCHPSVGSVLLLSLRGPAVKGWGVQKGNTLYPYMSYSGQLMSAVVCYSGGEQCCARDLLVVINLSSYDGCRCMFELLAEDVCVTHFKSKLLLDVHNSPVTVYSIWIFTDTVTLLFNVLPLISNVTMLTGKEHLPSVLAYKKWYLCVSSW